MNHTSKIESSGKDEGGADGAGGKRVSGIGRTLGRLRFLGEEWVLQLALVGAVFVALTDAVVRVGGSSLI